MWERRGARSVRDLIEIMSVITLYIYIYILRVGGTSFSPVSGLRKTRHQSPVRSKPKGGVMRRRFIIYIKRLAGRSELLRPRNWHVIRGRSTCIRDSREKSGPPARDDQTQYRTCTQGDLSGTCTFSYRVRWLWKFLKRT